MVPFSFKSELSYSRVMKIQLLPSVTVDDRHQPMTGTRDPHLLTPKFWLLNNRVQRHAGHAGSRQLAKFADKNYFQKSSLKRDGPVFFQIEAARIGIKMKKRSQKSGGRSQEAGSRPEIGCQA
jgi:hypothetical protein